MRRPLLLAVLLGVCLPTPALADVTVRYRAVTLEGAPANVRQNSPELTIAADGAGQVRLEMTAPGVPAREGARAPSVALITREGVGYIAMNGPMPGMQIVARQDDVLALLSQFAGPILTGPARATVQQVRNQRVEITPVGPERVAGVEGNLYRIVVVSGETRSPPFELVVATDPRLAPVAQEFVRLVDSMRPTVVSLIGGEPQVFAALKGMFGLGAPLRIGNQMRLDSISTEDVPDSRFALPGPVMSREQLQAMVGTILGGMGQGRGAPVQIRPSDGPAPATPAPANPPGNASNPH